MIRSQTTGFAMGKEMWYERGKKEWELSAGLDTMPLEDRNII